MTLLNMCLVKLVNEGVISEDEMHSFIEQVQKELRQAHDKIHKANAYLYGKTCRTCITVTSRRTIIYV